MTVECEASSLALDEAISNINPENIFVHLNFIVTEARLLNERYAIFEK